MTEILQVSIEPPQEVSLQLVKEQPEEKVIVKQYTLEEQEVLLLDRERLEATLPIEEQVLHQDQVQEEALE